MKKYIYQKGSVSLFVVIFAALLITVVTISFIKIMIQNQQQANAADLSQSAYDSALAGVEDAKRALLKYQDICNSGGDCAAAKTKINSTICNAAVEMLSDITPGNEIKVETNGPNSLDQAYTCVKINTETPDYLGQLKQDVNMTIPLIGVSDFNRIKIEWFSSKDLQGSGSTVDVPSMADGTPLLNQDSWTSPSRLNRPPVIRAQLIKYDTSSFKLDGFSNNNTSSNSNSSVFLYPSNIAESFSTLSNSQMSSSDNPVLIHCNASLSAGGYACSATLPLPNAYDSTHRSYMILRSFYKNTNFRVTLVKNDASVRFDGVQPSIDSTGRANDLFRRVQARVEGFQSTLDPEIVINGNLCKNFMVTDTERYEGSPSCNP